MSSAPPIAAVRCLAVDEADPAEPLARLVSTLADGRSHAKDALARRCDIDAGRLDALLDMLAGAGLWLETTPTSARTRPFAPLAAGRIRAALAARDEHDDGPRWTVRTTTLVGSTNDALLSLARSGTAPGMPMLLAAELQHAGRGRLGRRWRSTPGDSLTASFLWATDRALSALEGVTLACGLAVRDALRPRVPGVALKWPNDVMVRDRKLAGILVETAHNGRTQGRTQLVVGVGINLRATRGAPEPDDRASVAPIALDEAGAAGVDRDGLVADLATALARRLAAFDRDGFAPMAAEWNAADAFHERRVLLAAAGEPGRVGIERGVDATGALTVDVDGVGRRFVAGELSLRLAP